MARHRSNPRHDPVKVGACFEQCDELPHLLVSVAVGDRRFASALMIYRRLNHKFAHEADLALDTWCADYTELKQAMTNAWLAQDRKVYFGAKLRLETTFIKAFGEGDLLVKAASTISKHTRRSYVNILRHRCSLCEQPIDVFSRSGLQAPLSTGRSPYGAFTFSHVSCEDRHCCSLNNEAILELCAPPSANKIINFNISNTMDRFNSVMHYLRPFENVGDIMAATSSLTQYINKVAYRKEKMKKANFESPVRRWIHPHPLVESEDTLIGAIGVSHQMVEGCVDKAQRRRDDVRRVTEERKLRQVANAKEAVNAREANLRLCLAMSKLPWHTISAMRAWHKRLPEISGCVSFLDFDTGSATRVMRMAAFVADVFIYNTRRSYHQSTIDFFLLHGRALLPEPRTSWNLRGQYWNDNVALFRSVADVVDSFYGDDTTLTFRRRINTNEGLSEEHRPVPLMAAEFQCTQFVVTIVRKDADGITTHTPKTTIQDDYLYQLRAICGMEKELPLEDDIATWEPGNLDTPSVAVVTSLLKAGLRSSKRVDVLEKLGVPSIVEDMVALVCDLVPIAHSV
tara:strand:- start:12649 stop:14358 length:1710 start_codon:yes stop_codon:yes gene_type:complete